MSLTFENLQRNGFDHLDRRDTYLDWTGGAQAPHFLVDRANTLFKARMRGNAHSPHRPSKETEQEIDATRDRILRFYNAPNGEYDVIFTSGATAAIMLMIHFMWEDGELIIPVINHNSANGLCEVARAFGASTTNVGATPDLQIDVDELGQALRHPSRNSGGKRLLVYPSKSNATGIRHSLEFITQARESGVLTLLDDAAGGANKRLDLSVHKPDFVPVSFYKLFGYPTGLGCLLVRRASYAVLRKRWFAGGSVMMVSALQRVHQNLQEHGAFEDGSVSFHMIPTTINGLDFLDRLEPNGDERERHARSLADLLRDGLKALHLQDQRIEILGEGVDTVTFNLYHRGLPVPPEEFAAFASKERLFVRPGCFCNPGELESFYGLHDIDMVRLSKQSWGSQQELLHEMRKLAGNRPVGAIRASFGYGNNVSHVQKAIDAVTRFFANKARTRES